MHPLNYQKGGTWRLVPEEPPPNTSLIPRTAGSAPELTGCTHEVIYRSTCSAEVSSCPLLPSAVWLHPFLILLSGQCAFTYAYVIAPQRQTKISMK